MNWTPATKYPFHLKLVLDALRDHVKAVVDPPVPQPVSVTTHKTSYDTAVVWKKIFAQIMPRLVENI